MNMTAILAQISKRQDIIFALFLIMIVCMLVLPLPVIMVDMLIAFNIGLTLLLLVTTTYLKTTLELSTFPTIILVTTIFRLALTVSTTRLILTKGDAGHIIKSFGDFLVGGSVAIGFIIFLIIAIVQFIVVTKGAERISEVSARFTLDGLPAKQMAIDADLRNGDIDKDGARKRRFELEKESQFFGAMDGAMKFVKGDAISSLVIIFVNLLGGLAVGTMQKGMQLSAAAKHYSILSIGDGLVAQIPAMFVSVAAGMVVTRVVTENSTSLGSDIGRELAADPRALGITSGALLVMAFLPGFPTTIFLALSLMLGGGAYMIVRNAKKVVVDEAQAVTDAEAAKPRKEPLPSAQPGDLYTIVLHPQTRHDLANIGLERELRPRANGLRTQIGFRYPVFGFRSNILMPRYEMRFDVGDVPSLYIKLSGMIDVPATSEAQLSALNIPFDKAVNAFNQMDIFVPDEYIPALDSNQIPYRTAAQRIADHVAQSIQQNIAPGFGVQEANNWLNDLQEDHGRLVSDVQNAVPILRVVEVGRQLLDEGITLTQPRVLLESLLKYAPQEPDNDVLAEIVRSSLRRQVIFNLLDTERRLPLIVLGSEIEDYIQVLLHGTVSAFGQEPSSDATANMYERINEAVLAAMHQGRTPVIATSHQARSVTRDFLRRRNIHTPVIAMDEIGADIETEFLAVLS
jgi:type III secretion protein V